MSRTRCVLIAVVSMALSLTVLAMVPATAAPVTAQPTVSASTATAGVPAVARKKKKKKKNRYKPKSGPIFNEANGSYASKNRINRQVLTAVRNARKGSVVRVVTWSFFGHTALRTLIDAHKRGVGVRFIMAAGRSKDQPYFYNTLRRELRKGNKKRPKALRSGARTCAGTCRGRGGTLHSKMFLFSHTGKARDVVMWGSPNLTSAAVRIQWNDLFTSVGRPNLYDYADKIFRQMWRQKRVMKGSKIHWYGSKKSKQIGFSAFPYSGGSDWVTKQLRKVRCTGATNMGDGKTRVQIAQAVLRGRIGDRIARELKRLYNSGCRVSVIYTVKGKSTSRILSSGSGRGAIPMRHYVQDTNGDGFYDKYLHMKVLAIKGVIGKKTNATLVKNGSENWSDMSKGNDELVGYFRAGKFYNKYSKWMDWLWNHVPRSVPLTTYARKAPPKNPYKYLELD